MFTSRLSDYFTFAIMCKLVHLWKTEKREIHSTHKTKRLVYEYRKKPSVISSMHSFHYDVDSIKAACTKHKRAREISINHKQVSSE